MTKGGLTKSVANMSKWIIVMTVVFFISLTINYLKSRKENYSDLHRRVKELEDKVGKLNEMH